MQRMCWPYVHLNFEMIFQINTLLFTRTFLVRRGDRVVDLMTKVTEPKWW